MVINRAGISGKNFEERNKWYEYYLSVSLNKGYRVIIKRDVDEIFTNNYNPEWLKCWNANMDISPVLKSSKLEFDNYQSIFV